MSRRKKPEIVIDAQERAWNVDDFFLDSHRVKAPEDDAFELCAELGYPPDQVNEEVRERYRAPRANANDEELNLAHAMSLRDVKLAADEAAALDFDAPGKKGGCDMATCRTRRSRGGTAVFAVAAFALLGSCASHAASIKAFIVPANDGSTVTNGQVLRFDSRTGAFDGVLVPGQGPSQIQGLTRGPDGSLYGSTFDTQSNTDGRVLRLRPDGAVETFVAAGSGGLYSPLGLTFGADGNLYVANNLGNVLRYDGATGAFLDVFASGLSVPQDVVFGPDGHLYVSNGFGPSISRFDGATGASLGFFVAPGAFGLEAPVGLAFGRTEDLYVASFPANTIFRFDGTTGALIGVFDLPYRDGLDALLDLAFGPDQNLYASVRVDGVGTSILRLDPDSGAVLAEFASLPGPLGFNTGMLFVDQACSSLKSVEGQASGCFATRPAPEPGALGLLALGLVGLAGLRRKTTT